MKKAFFLTIIIGFFIHCNAQLSYEHLFDFELPENVYPVGIRVFDYNNDNIDEISFINHCDSMWIFYVYEQNGNQILYYEEILNGAERLLDYCVYSDSISTYFIAAIRSSYYNVTIKKYELNSFNLISEYSIYIWDLNIPYTEYGGVNEICMSIIYENNTFYLNIGLKLHFDYSYPGGRIITHFDDLVIFQISDQIEYLGDIPDCSCVQPISKIGIGDYYLYEEWSNGTSNTDRHTWLKQISYGNNPSANNILDDNGSLKLLTGNDNTFFEYGAIFYNWGTYFCMDPELNEILWTNSVSNLIGPVCYSNLTVNNENHYLLYSLTNHIEIRNRIDGSIVHFEESNLFPRKILKTQNDQILFIEYSYYNDYGSIYILTDINFVNVLDNEIIQDYSSITNYPNPFNPTTTIAFSVTQNTDFVNLEVYNIKGQKVTTLINEQMQKGQHSIIWSGLDSNNKPVSSGIYFYKLNVNGKTEAVKKCLLLK